MDRGSQIGINRGSQVDIMAEDLAKGNADVNHQHKLFLVSSQPDGQLCYSIVHQYM